MTEAAEPLPDGLNTLPLTAGLVAVLLSDGDLAAQDRRKGIPGIRGIVYLREGPFGFPVLAVIP